METEVLVGTRKGLFVLKGDRSGPLEVASRHFNMVPVDFACYDPRSGLYLAGVTHFPEEFAEFMPDGAFGPHLYYTDDLDAEWQDSGLKFPEGIDEKIEKVWSIVPGVAEGEVWCGVAPAALFHSTDGGKSWTLNQALWDDPTRPQWVGGGGGLCLHSICPYPGDPSQLTLGISSVGVFHTEDAGASWTRRIAGLPREPEDAPDDEQVQCVHSVHRSPVQPETMYVQFHNGVFRSDDGARTWNSIDAGLPSNFGLPMAIDPGDPDRAFVIPLQSEMDRVTVDGKVRVFETADRGANWETLSEGLPEKGAYLTLLRQAMCTDDQKELGIYFGATSGDLFGTADSGRNWFQAARFLPPVHSVRMGHVG